MKNVTLKLSEVLNLDAELSGVTNPSTGEQLVPGILGLELDFKLKYHLSKLNSQVAEEKKHIEAFRNDLITKYGEKTEGDQFSVPFLINVKKDENGQIVSGDPNPKYEEFVKEFEAFLNEDTEFKVKGFTLADFEGIKLKNTPTVLFSLLDEEETA